MPSLSETARKALVDNRFGPKGPESRMDGLEREALRMKMRFRNGLLSPRPQPIISSRSIQSVIEPCDGAQPNSRRARSPRTRLFEPNE